MTNALENRPVTGRVTIPGDVAAQYADLYGMEVAGNCIAPVVNDGEHIIASADAELIADLPVVVLPKDGKPMVKLLVNAPPPHLMKVADGSTVVPVISVLCCHVSWKPRKRWHRR